MRKVTTIVAAAAVALAFTACNKTNNAAPTPEANGTYGSLVVNVANGLRALDQVDETGRAAESKIASMDLVGNITMSWTPSAANGAGFWETAQGSGIYRTAPFSTTEVGNRTLALVLNKGAITMPTAANMKTLTYGAKASALEDIAALSTEDQFVMTSASDIKDIKSGVSEADANANDPDDAKNIFRFEVERVVAQAYVAKGTGLKGETTDKRGDVDLTNMTYSVMNGAASTYVMKNNAGLRTMGADNQYKDFKSAIDEKTFAEADQESVDFLVRIGDLGKTTNADLGGYKAIPVAEEAYKKGGQETNRGIYFLENSYSEELTPANKVIGYARLATAKVYVTFVPKEVYGVKEGAVAQFTEDATSKVWFKKTDKKVTTADKEITTTTYTDRTISDEKPTEAENGFTWVRGTVTYKPQDIAKVEGFTSGTTFYIGNNDHVAYNSVEAALSNGNTLVSMYKDGRCGYYALLNRTPEEGVQNAETRRNNIYSLTITGFATLGFNFDPLDPNDPNLPKPNPKDPNNNPDPNNHTKDIEPTKTYMQVQGEVILWNLVSRGVILGA